jgi:hypothetical protein
MPDQATVGGHSGDISPLQRELEELEGSPSVSRVRRRVRRKPPKVPVSNDVHDKAKLQWHYTITDTPILKTIL